jgi:hypothetical protein
MVKFHSLRRFSAGSTFEQGTVWILLLVFIGEFLLQPALAESLPEHLDLSSTTASIEAPAAGQIQIAGQDPRQISAGMLLTPAEFVALTQVQSGQQELTVNSLGAAVGGSLNLGPSTSLANFVLPQGVVAYSVVSSSSGGAASESTVHSLNIAGQASIAGSILMQAENGIINASNLQVAAGGQISNALAQDKANLTLNVLGSLANAGLISSTGDLSVLVGQSISNFGVIQSTLGNVNFAGSGSSFVVNNAGGNILAPSGTVNIQTAVWQSQLAVSGGALQAQNINLTALQGAISLAAQQVQGAVSIKARELSAAVSSGDLNIARLDLSGDPVFNVAGNFISPGGNFAGELFQVTANGNITITSDLNTASTTGRGGNVVLVAGGAVDVQGGINTSGLDEAGHIALLGRNGVTAANIKAVALAAGGSGGSIYASADAPISLGSLDVSSGVGGRGGDVLVTAVGGLSGTNHNVVTGSIAGAHSEQIYEDGSVPVSGTLPVAFTNSGPLPVTPSMLPGGGFVSFDNDQGQITLSRDIVVPLGLGDGFAGFDDLVVPFFVSDPAGANFEDVFGVPGSPATKGQEFVAVSVGSINASRVANSAAGAPLPGGVYVAGEITLASTSGSANLQPKPFSAEIDDTTDYNTGTGQILLVNSGGAELSTLGRGNFFLPTERTGHLTLGGGLIVSRGGGGLQVSSDNVDLSPAMNGRLSIDADGPVNFSNAIAIFITLSGDLPFVVRAVPNGSSPLNQALGFGALLSSFDIGGTSPSIQVEGGGIAAAVTLLDLAAGASLSLSAESFVLLLAETITVPASSRIDVSVTSPNEFGTQLISILSDLALANISVNGSGLTIGSGGKVSLSGDVTSVSSSTVSNGIFILSGDPTGGSFRDSSEIGISVNPGSNLTAVGGNLALNVYGADTNPLSLPVAPLVNVDSASLQSIGGFVGQTPVGGVVGIVVNGPPPTLVEDFIPLSDIPFAQLDQMVVQRHGQSPPLRIENAASMSFDDGQLVTGVSGFTVALSGGGISSAGNGLATILERNVSGSVVLTGSALSAQGGGLLIDPGGTYSGEIIVNNSTIVGSLPFLLLPEVPEGDGVPGVSSNPFGVRFNLPSDPQKNALVPTDLTPVNKGVLQSLTDMCQQAVTFSVDRNVGVGSDNGEEWLIAPGICQPFVFQHSDGLFLIGSSGATVGRSGARSLEIESGKLVVLATKDEGCVFGSRYGKVEISGSSASIVECRNDSGKSVLVVSSIAGAPVKFVGTDRSGRTRQLEVPPGQQLVVTAAESSPGELAGVDSIDRARNQKMLACDIAISTFDANRMLDDTSSFMCRFDCVGVMGSDNMRSLKAYIQRKWGLVPSSSGAHGDEVSIRHERFDLFPERVGDLLSDSGNLLVVRFDERIASSSGTNETRLRTVITDKAETRYIGDTTLSFNEQQHMTLYEGEVLLSAFEDVSVRAGSYSISVSEGGMVHVCQQGDVTKVRNVYEHKRKSVKVSLGANSFAISAGEEALLVGRKQYNVNSLNDQVGRRDIRRLDLPNGHSIASSEVSIVGLIHNSKLLREVINSKQKRDRLLASKLISMAACLQMVTVSHGPYVAIHK